jgi:catechol 2,3-dioxygenase-like lactoylglutathione lyase family enzyme
MADTAASEPALRVHAVMLGVRDLAASTGFFTERLGFTLTSRFGDFAFLDAGGTSIVLSTQLARARPPTAPAPVEIVLAVDGVRAAYDRLRASGVVFLNEPHTIDGTNDGVNFEDLDGHLFSLFGPP